MMTDGVPMVEIAMATAGDLTGVVIGVVGVVAQTGAEIVTAGVAARNLTSVMAMVLDGEAVAAQAGAVIDTDLLQATDMDLAQVMVMDQAQLPDLADSAQDMVRVTVLAPGMDQARVMVNLRHPHRDRRPLKDSNPNLGTHLTARFTGCFFIHQIFTGPLNPLLSLQYR